MDRLPEGLAQVIALGGIEWGDATDTEYAFFRLEDVLQFESELEPVVRAAKEAGDDVHLWRGRSPISTVAISWQSLAVAVVPALCTALGAWLGSRNGRKLRIKIGDIEAEAQTREQVEELLARAQEIQQEIQQRNQPPRVIP